MKPNNPSLIVGYHSPEYFCDRVQGAKTMSDALDNGRNLTLMLPAVWAVTLYMDIYYTQSKTSTSKEKKLRNISYLFCLRVPVSQN